MTNEHLTADRAWKLIGNRSTLGPAEVEHVRFCDDCHEFLVTFVHLARIAGFNITLDVPAKIEKKRPA
jgi:hypothetical protein